MARKSTHRGQGGLYKRGDFYWITYSVSGNRHREPTGTTDKKEALDFLARRKGQVARDGFIAPSKLSIGELLNLVNNEYDLQGTSSAYIEALRIDKHLMPVFGNMKAAEFTSVTVDRYIRDRLKHAAPATVNRELALLRHAYTLGFRADPPMVTRVPYIRKLDESDNVRTGFLKPELYKKLLAALAPELKLMFIMGYHYGLRKGALLEMRWEWVDLESGEIRLPGVQARNRKPRPKMLPIFGDVRKYLDSQPRESEFLFARGSAPIKDFRKSWANACAAAGVPDLLFHDLRRTAVRNMLRAGVNEKLAMEISGHRTRAIFDRYSISDATDKKSAGKAMETYHEKEQAG